MVWITGLLVTEKVARLEKRVTDITARTYSLFFNRDLEDFENRAVKD